MDWGNLWNNFTTGMNDVSNNLFSKDGVFSKASSFLGSDAGKGLVNAGSFLTNAYLGLEQLDAIKQNNALQQANYNRNVNIQNTNDASINSAVADIFGTKKRKKSTPSSNTGSPFQDINVGQ